MFTETLTASHFILPGFYIFGGVFIGYVFEKIVFHELRKLAEKTSWEGDDVIIKALKLIAVVWLGLLGAYLAMRDLPFEPARYEIIQTGILIAFVVAATWFATRLAAGFVRLYTSVEGSPIPSSSIFINLTRLAVLLVGGLIILQILEQPITPLLTAAGVGGLAIALGLQDTLASLFSGLNIMVSKKINIGDFVELESGEQGYITDINWRYTTIKQLSNDFLIVPNASLAKETIKNYSLPKEDKSVRIKCGVGYNSDLEHVEQIVIATANEVIKKHDAAVKDKEPTVRFHTFGESSIDFTLYMRAKRFADQFELKHDMIKALHKRFAKENIEIPYPQVDVHQRK